MTVGPPLETLRLSERERDSLLHIKRLTGIDHWNTLCRWAFCVSLREGPVTPAERVTSSPDSGVEIAWRTLVGESEIGFLALVTASAGLTLATPQAFLRQHISRGIALLHARLQTDSRARKAEVSRLSDLLLAD